MACLLIGILGTVLPAVHSRGQTSPPATMPPDTLGESADGEPYRLRAARLEGISGAGERTLKAFDVTVTHGPTTVTGDSAYVYESRELVEFRGNVRVLDGSTRMWGDEASYDRRTRVASLKGNVRIRDGSTLIRGRDAYFYRADNRALMTGKPFMEDSTRTLVAERIEYDRGANVMNAFGSVEAYDRAESIRVRAGRMRYDRGVDYARAEIDPVLEAVEAGGDTTLIRSLTMEFDNARREVYAIGHVRIDRRDLHASCDRAELYDREERALLLGSPTAWDEEAVARGDTLEIRFQQDRVESVTMRPNAIVDYEQRVGTGRGERNHATGDAITLTIEENAARRALITGEARSEYWPSSADSAEGGRNISYGDTIHVAFEGGRPSQAIVRGRSRGTYFMAAEGDTSEQGRREVVEYKGREIVYDVSRGSVDIEGSADVVYGAVHLTATRVVFDSNTQRMRAEGQPVLQDGKDRIVGHTMTYDLSIRRGTVYAGRTTYERGYFYGERVRRVSEDVLDVENGSYTTCDIAEPHYKFGSSKMKILVGDKVIARPIIFYVHKIPVFALPFYVFPIRGGRHSGFQLPQFEFGSSSGGGKFIRNVGYYLALNDYMDATAWGDYYQGNDITGQGARWIGHGQFRYHKRYGYQGTLSGSYSYQKNTNSLGFETVLKRWDLVGSHYQTLGPRFSLAAQVNRTSSSDYLRDASIGRSLTSRVQRYLKSNLTLSKAWSGVSLDGSLIRNEDLDPDPRGLRVEQQLPSIRFSLSARPIGRAARGREPARLPALASTVVSVRSALASQRNIYVNDFNDSIPLMDRLDARTGVRTDVTLTDVRQVLGVFRLSPGMSYTEVFYSRDAAGNGNQRAGIWSGRLSMNTAVFGTFSKSIGPLRAVRHVITPEVGFDYQPHYGKLLYTDTGGIQRARFDRLGQIGELRSAETRRVRFSIRQDVHIKYGDPAEPKVRNNLIQLQTSGSYDLLAHRTGRRGLTDLLTSLRLRPTDRGDFDFRFVHDPYTGTLKNFDATTGFTLAGARRGADAGDQTLGLEEPGTDAVRAVSALAPAGLTPAGLPWSVSLSVAYAGFRDSQGGWQSSRRANGSLGMNLTKNWRFDYAAMFDFASGRMVAQNYNVKRDLHCWEMQFTRSISGENTEYYFKINVKNLPEVYYEQGSQGLRGFGGIDNLY